MPKQHILVLGATGPSGLLFCEAALQAGHALTLFVRNASKVPQTVTEGGKVNIIEGALTQEDRLQAAAECGATVFVSFAGPGYGHQGTPLTDGYKRLIPLLSQNRFERAIVLLTASWIAPEDNVALKWKLIAGMVRMFAGNAYADINGIGNYTMFRVPFLSDAGPAEVHSAYLGSPNIGLKLSRSSMVQWVLREIDEARWTGKAPCLSNCE
ncbi:NAD(P)-binding protein [Zopfia rhizophila CBS 207.26]|uniref:NAD(P)-binding protein n=1 Tax=Zopfia rhizophila CBS 207.26 TaxID=1314779 RepID=A0A6A6DZ74_9PEZI|nr:NAD(P)-binding protein [Zopfia rhizophila CBS 207.26]